MSLLFSSCPIVNGKRYVVYVYKKKKDILLLKTVNLQLQFNKFCICVGKGTKTRQDLTATNCIWECNFPKYEFFAARLDSPGNNML